MLHFGCATFDFGCSMNWVCGVEIWGIGCWVGAGRRCWVWGVGWVQGVVGVFGEGVLGVYVGGGLGCWVLGAGVLGVKC